MNYCDALLLWSPGTPDAKSSKLMITRLHPHKESKAAEIAYFGTDCHVRSAGAAYISVKHGSIEDNARKVMVDFNSLVVGENMDVQAVHDVFCEIQEYRDQLAPDTQVPEQWRKTFQQETA